MLKRLCISCAVSVVMLGNASAAAQIYSTEQNEDYGDIYSTRGNRDIYTTADDRQGIYTTRDSGSIYSTVDKREGTYTTKEQPPAPGGTADDVPGAELKDDGTVGAGSVYDGYMPE